MSFGNYCMYSEYNIIAQNNIGYMMEHKFKKLKEGMYIYDVYRKILMVTNKIKISAFSLKVH